MAKLPALVTALAECDGRDRATIDHFARTIREAGLLPTTKRGVGSASMNVREAANLLIAIKASENAKDAAAVVRTYRTLVPFIFHNEDDVASCVIPLRRVAAAERFGDALEQLILSAANIAGWMLAKVASERPELDEQSLVSLAISEVAWRQVEVSIARPVPYATIRIVNHSSGRRVVEFEQNFTVDTSLLMQGFYTSGHHADGKTTTTFGLKTLLKLSELVVSDEKATELAAEAVEG